MSWGMSGSFHEKEAAQKSSVLKLPWLRDVNCILNSFATLPLAPRTGSPLSKLAALGAEWFET